MNYNIGNQQQLNGVIATGGAPVMIPYENVGYYLPFQNQMVQWVAIPQPPYPQRQCVEFVNPQIYSNEKLIQSLQHAKISRPYIESQNQWTNATKQKPNKNVRSQNVDDVNHVNNNLTSQQQTEHVFQHEFSPALFGADKSPPQCFNIIGRGNLPSINFSIVYSAK